ncbi:MAG: hypothetical protein KDC25_12980 [Saprospiraceae bacterium]|nr:hypothetical protein [Saprospiraceae bacterium]
MKKRFKILICGILLFSLVQILQHYLTFEDWIYGILTGLTVGIMVIGLVKTYKLKKAS